LLAKSWIFKQKASTRAEEAKNRAEQHSEGVCHARLLSQFACGTQRCILLKLLANTILSNDRGGKNAKKRAVVAVARKLAVWLHKLWVSGEVYEPLRNNHQVVSAVA
jgi:hypothetical protein